MAINMNLYGGAAGPASKELDTHAHTHIHTGCVTPHYSPDEIPSDFHSVFFNLVKKHKKNPKQMTLINFAH